MEEHLYVVGGHGRLHLGSHTFELRPGSYVCFPAGQPEFHCLENPGPEVFRYVIVGERLAEDKVCYEQDPARYP